MLENNFATSDSNLEDIKFKSPINIKSLSGMIEVVDSIPSFSPKTFYDSIKIYNNDIYYYNYKTGSWCIAGALGYTAENVLNKDTDATLSANSDTKYPSQKAIKSYVDGINFNLTSLIAGENISIGDIVCVKPSYTDYIASDDSYVYQASPTTNYGTEETVRIGQDAGGFVYESFLKWGVASLPSPELILKAELIINQRVAIGGATTININRVTGGDWAEGTINYNNKPSVTDDIASKFGMQKSYTSATGSHTLDITQLVRQWKSGNINNYGIYLFGSSGADTHFDLDSSETTLGISYKPVLRIYTTNASDSKAYKADITSYLTSRSVVGVAMANKNYNESLNIQFSGRCINLALNSESAGIVYLNTAGGVVTSSNNLNRVISLGKILSSNSCLLNIQDKGILIEKLYASITTTGTQRFYASSDTRFARIYFYSDSGTSQKLWVDVYRDSDGLKSFNFGVYTASGTGYWNFSWGSNYIDIEANFNEITNIYFYS